MGMYPPEQALTKVSEVHVTMLHVINNNNTTVTNNVVFLVTASGYNFHQLKKAKPT